MLLIHSLWLVFCASLYSLYSLYSPLHIPVHFLCAAAIADIADETDEAVSGELGTDSGNHSNCVSGNRSNRTSRMIFFGYQPGEMRRLLSSLEHSFDSNRNVLSHLMKSIDQSVILMNEIDSRTDKLKYIHDEFRKQAMNIPHLWEKNEELLRYLVPPSKLIITYAISDAISLSSSSSDLHENSHENSHESIETKNIPNNIPDNIPNNIPKNSIGTESTKKKVNFNIPKEHSSTPKEHSSIPKKPSVDIPPPSYDSLEQILVHLCRDWSSQGRLIRERLYTDGIIKKLMGILPVEMENLPVDNGVFECASNHNNTSSNNNKSNDDNSSSSSSNSTANGSSSSSCGGGSSSSNNSTTTISRTNTSTRNNLGIRILVPGAGLGRLAAELAARGYAVEVNDCSGLMLAALRTIIEDILPEQNSDRNHKNESNHMNNEDSHENHESRHENNQEQKNGTESNHLNSMNIDNNGSNKDHYNRYNQDNDNNNRKNNSIFEFYPHITPKLTDNWDFKARLNSVIFPSDDSYLVAKWAKEMKEMKSEKENSIYHNKTNNKNIPASRNHTDNGHANHTNHTATHTECTDNRHNTMTVQMGGFTNVYGHSDHADQFDSVVTCFFIDTATDILEYIAVIAHVLRPGGIWVNAGPLHYHVNTTIMYSYQQLIQVIQACGFEVISQSIIETTSYSGEEEFSMKPEYYSVPLDVFRLVRKEDKWPVKNR